MSEENYEVGYKKPPKAGQFQKGKSGNPKGRPKGHKNYKTMLQEALREPVIIQENGAKKTVPKIEAIFKQLVNRAAKGDDKAIQRLIPMAFNIDEQHENSERTKTIGTVPPDFIESLKLRIPSVDGGQGD